MKRPRPPWTKVFRSHLQSLKTIYRLPALRPVLHSHAFGVTKEDNHNRNRTHNPDHIPMIPENNLSPPYPFQVFRKQSSQKPPFIVNLKDHVESLNR